MNRIFRIGSETSRDPKRILSQKSRSRKFLEAMTGKQSQSIKVKRKKELKRILWSWHPGVPLATLSKRLQRK